jgi:hypothetical protein
MQQNDLRASQIDSLIISASQRPPSLGLGSAGGHE